MIDRTQLSQALARLDPRDREVLDYSLRRHVPDGDLAAVFGCGASEVARMRAGAVERLADDLGVQRGTDLVLYAQVMGFAFVTVSTWVRFREQELRYSRLARTIALANAVRPEDQIDVRIMKPVRDDDPLQA